MRLIFCIASGVLGRKTSGWIFGQGHDLSPGGLYLKVPFICYPVYCGDLLVRCTQKKKFNVGEIRGWIHYWLSKSRLKKGEGVIGHVVMKSFLPKLQSSSNQSQ